MACVVTGSTIVLSGDVGDMGWYWDEADRGFTAGDVIAALAQIGDGRDVIVRLNSGGGIATEGSAIHAALSRHRGQKTVFVEGVAASAASIIAMAGDDVVMCLGAVMMIHDPAALTMGTAADHEGTIAGLTALGDAMAGVYAAKSGQAIEACRADMKAETWMTPDQAVAKGYADRVENSPDAGVEPTEDEIQARINAAVAEEREKHKAPENVAATAVSRSDAAAIAKACNDGGVPAMTAALLAEGATLAQATARIGAAGRIKDMVALARGTNPAIPADLADTMIREGKTVEQATAALFDQMVAKGAGSDDEGVRSFHRSGSGGADTAGSPTTGGRPTATTRARGKALMAAAVKSQGLVPKTGA